MMVKETKVKVVIIKKTKNKENILSQKLNVAAYARVSTELEGQITSFDSQQIYYKEKIKRNVNWTFVKVYADFGISGTQKKILQCILKKNI